MKNIKYFTIFFLVLSLYNCQSDNDLIDTEKPFIQIEAPHFGESFEAGNVLLIKATLSDNKALKAYRIDIHEIHSDEEGHDHEEIPFEFDESFDIPTELKTLKIEKEIALPEHIMSGHYYLTVFLLDQSANEQKRSVEIEIKE